MSLFAFAARSLARERSWLQAKLVCADLEMRDTANLVPIFVEFALAAYGVTLIARLLINRLPGIGMPLRAIPRASAMECRVSAAQVSMMLNAILSIIPTFSIPWPTPKTRMHLYADTSCRR
jgi:hypothetical protein